MGMAASQARFLGLTARKNNVEYEGQQINQQRTTLSNTTANYYNDLLGMTVPVPPSVEDYTKTVYTFQDGALTNSISTMIAQGNGEYLISYTSNWIDDFSAVSTSPSIVTRTKKPETGVALVANDYMVGAKILRNMNEGLFRVEYEDQNGNRVKSDDTFFYDPTSKQYYTGYDPVTGEYDENTALDPSEYTDYKMVASIDDDYLDTLSEDQLQRLQEEERNYINVLISQYGGDKKDWTVRYVKNTSANTWEPIFCKLSELNSENTIYSDNGASLSTIKMYTIGSLEKNEEIKGIKARFEQDSSGRLINVTLKPGEPDEVTYAITTNTMTDQAKYDDAMNQYEFDKAQYDQTIQEINAKIEIIQAEDKNLELRLKQLDTEQEAIQTEMDAVQKVIEKNTESTFKTFG